mgnify:FL=1
MSTVRIQACAVQAITPQQMRLGAFVQVELSMTPGQRLSAVAQLLGSGMSEQEAYEGLRAMFPQWFEVTA